ncbi:MAG: OmpP1/FadL family transporter [Gammaproteobacteria bacterium]|nr:OmpP1/FadL family transporter [Gammaproteobacteria bacterium]
MKKQIFTLALMCFSSSLLAGGYRVALQGNNATGMGHTGVAMSDNAEVVFFNPAAMSLLDSASDFSVGTILINSTIKYQNRDTSSTAETDNSSGTPAYLYYARKFDDRLAFGLGMYTPYGNSVKWPKDWAGSHLVNDISLFTVFVQPSVSYKVNDMLSIGGGPIYAYGSVDFNRNLNSSLVDASNQRANVTLKATGVTDWGYTLSTMLNPIDNLSVGLSYRSEMTLKARGEDANFEHIPSSLSSTYKDTTFDADLALPAELTVGLAYKVLPTTTVALDINRVFWSAYKSLDITFKGVDEPALGPRNYQDSNVYRIGVQHQFNPKFTFRLGAYYDDSPVEDGYFSPETPRNNSLGLTTGASYKFTKKLAVDVSFLYLMFKEFNGSYDYVGHDNDPNTKDESFGGDYISTVTTFGFGLNYQY